MRHLPASSFIGSALRLSWCRPSAAILKGWFDRVWAPGVAFDHAVNGGVIAPRAVFVASTGMLRNA